MNQKREFRNGNWALEWSSMELCIALSRNGLYPESFEGWGWGSYFVNWVRLGNGASFSLLSLVSWAGGGENNWLNQGARVGSRRPLCLWFRFLTFSSFVFFMYLTVCFFPPEQSHPRTLFFKEDLEPLSIPLFTFHTLFTSCTYHSVLHLIMYPSLSSSHHPLNR